MTTCAVLFVKRPAPGRVKTRMQPALSAGSAATLYRAFVLDAMDLLAAAGADRRVVAYAPADAGAAVAALVEPRDLELVPQVEGDIGARMAGAFAWSAREGNERTVLIGSDIPSLPVSFLDRALALLESHEVVIGPATDGGYYLVGVRGHPPDIFDGVPWSTGGVLAATLSRLGDLELGLLPPWYDADTVSGARMLRDHLEALHRAGEPRAPRSLVALRALLPPA